MQKTLWIAVALALGAGSAQAADPPGTRRVAAGGGAALSDWDFRIGRLEVQGDLRLRRSRADELMPGRVHERFAQFHRGVPVWGGELVRQRTESETVSVFGTFYEGIELDVAPKLGAGDAERAVAARGLVLPVGEAPVLTVLPREAGYALAWRAEAHTTGEGPFDIRMLFLDAATGETLFEYSNLQTQSAVGSGTGVLSDPKKMSVLSGSGGFLADDQLRPPRLRTFDMRGSLSRTLQFLNGQIALGQSDLAADADNVWTDGAVVDAHAYAGYTYDYLYKRFGRRGLDDQNGRILSLVHPVNRSDIFGYSDSVISTFYLNAFYCCDGIMVYGEGLPSNLQLTTGQRVNYWSAALDVVAHELAHGVTDFTSALVYFGEPGALNESFSDIIAAGAEFFHQEAGSGTLRADWLLAEDAITPGGIRSMANPAAYGDPDHYSVRFTGSEDNGGVHINSSISNHAFYLAIEGGRNRVSGLSVTGVGLANREQVEKVFFRAFTAMLPPSADFAAARAATLQSARDLYGAGSNVERAIRDAWTAVGVQ
ncbi:MAG: M4 family metallopeptidase [Vicinamibacteria bacterium]|nr:M4 family metallopeptidase [Vicinamibacteria bacterium]